jgi:hypothetical protein
LPAKGFAKNCLIIFATTIAAAMAMPGVSPAMKIGWGFNK